MAQVRGSTRFKLGFADHSVSQVCSVLRHFLWNFLGRNCLAYKKITCLYPFNVQGGKSQVEANLVEACLSDLLINADTEHSPAQELAGAFSV